MKLAEIKTGFYLTERNGCRTRITSDNILLLEDSFDEHLRCLYRNKDDDIVKVEDGNGQITEINGE